MLTKLRIRNFKRFEDVTIDLGNPVVFVGPNDSGKTTALQALALWDLGLRRWNEKRKRTSAPEKRPGVTINQRDLMFIPVPSARLLWKGQHVRDVQRIEGKQQTTNVRLDVVVEGVTSGDEWSCGLEFDYFNEEAFYCRPLRLDDGQNAPRMPIPEPAMSAQVAFLPPMSGMADREYVKQQGEIAVLIGQGRTAEVLRNLCYMLYQSGDDRKAWEQVCDRVDDLFGVRLEEPHFIPERSEIQMSYRDRSGQSLDLSSAGRGMQQTLLLLTYLASNPGAILLLDEPDAHLEILRQRQTYQTLTEIARQQESQIIIASHSEVLLNEAADRDVVVAFVGKPHRIDDRGSQLRKSLSLIGFEQYYQAEITGWVLYLEGATDLAILKSFASILDHDARDVLERVFVHYVANQPPKVREHFYGLREAKSDIVGFALYDRLDRPIDEKGAGLTEYQWRKREMENYLCQRKVLLAWARSEGQKVEGGPLFAAPWEKHMEETIEEIAKAMKTLNKDPWSPDTKVSDEFLEPLFSNFFARLGIPNLMHKTNFYQLAAYVSKDDLDPEVGQVLDMIVDVSRVAKVVRE